MMSPVLLLLFHLVAALLAVQQSEAALVNFARLTPYDRQWQPPVTRWLLPSDPTLIPPADELAWRKLGSKIWTFLSTMDNDFVDATGKTVPPALAAQRLFGTQVTCGRFARQFIRIPFHDCGTYDVGNTGSKGDTGQPRFGCNGSLRWELMQCTAVGPQCVNGVEAAINFATGAFLPESAFDGVVAKYGAANVPFGFDAINPRLENTGFANSIAFFYQLKLETEIDEPPATRLASVSLADIMTYAGMLAVAKCGGPHIEFQPGRTDSLVFDPTARLPSPTEPLFHTISYFWTNGLTNFDIVNLLAAHTTACFSVGCLDISPSRFDASWARLILSVTGATDPRICQFPKVELPLVPGPDLPKPGPPPVNMCFLPADAELKARADIRNYLMALTGQMTIAAAAAVELPCTYQLGVPEVHGACDVGVGVGYDFVPFKLLSTPQGSVNLCSRGNIPAEDRSACPTAVASAVFRNAVATSYFKMSKMYVDAAGNNAGAPWGVVRQPCQPGLIVIGLVNVIQPVNPFCRCCPKQLPQEFSLGLEPVAGENFLNDMP